MRYTFEEGTWAGAEVWAWDGSDGVLIGQAHIVSHIGDKVAIQVRLHDGRTSPLFTDRRAALDWIAR